MKRRRIHVQIVAWTYLCRLTWPIQTTVVELSGPTFMDRVVDLSRPPYDCHLTITQPVLKR